MYAIVKAGGRQEKVEVGDTVTVDRIDAAVGATVSFPALLVVDGATVTTDVAALAAVKVTGEVLEETKDQRSTSCVIRTRQVTVVVKAFVQSSHA